MDKPRWRKDSWSNRKSGVGTSEDKGEHTGWRPSKEIFGLSTTDLDEIYECSRFARRIVDRPAADATRPAIEVRKGDTKQRPLQKKLHKDLGLKNLLGEAHRLSRHVGGGALLLMIDDGNDLNEPVNWDNVKELKTVHVFDKEDLTPQDHHGDLWNDDYGEPRLYSFHPNNQVTSSDHSILDPKGNPVSSSDEPANIHSDRVIKFIENDVRDTRRGFYDGWGQSVIEDCYSALKDLGVATSAISSAVHEFQFQVLKLAGLHEIIKSNENGEDLIAERLDEMNLSKSMINAIALDADRGESLEQRSVDFGGIVEAFTVLQQVFSAVTGMPLSLAFGVMPSGLSSNDDTGRDNYHDELHDMRTTLYTPAINYIVKVLAHSKKCTEVDRENYKSLSIHYGDFEQETEKEEAERFKILSSAISSLVQATVIGPRKGEKMLFQYVDEPEKKDSLEEGADYTEQPTSEVSDEYRFDRDVWRPSPETRETARRGLTLRDVYDRGGGEAAKTFAEAIIGGVVSKNKAKRILGFLKSQQQHFDPEKTVSKDDGPTSGTIAYQLAGGTEALDELIDLFEDQTREDSDPNDLQPEKQGKDAVEYTQYSEGKEKCSGCGWYKPGDGDSPGGCQIVEGDISPEGWCILWGTKEFAQRNSEDSEQRIDPFSGSNDPELPDHVKDIGKEAREEWVAVWNEVFEKTGDESKAYATANAAVS